MAEKADTYTGPGLYAFKDMSGNWRAGPKSKKYVEGQFVSEQYAKSVRGSINFRNRVKGLQESPLDQTPDTYNEAKSVVAEFNKLTDELNQAQKENNEQQIEEFEKEIKDLRADLGS